MKISKTLLAFCLTLCMSSAVYANSQPENDQNIPSKSIENSQSRPNEAGEIMVLMYHGLEKHKPKETYMRSIADFESDLKALYENGYRLISMSDLIDNNIQVAEGYTPVVLTFDDGFNTAFSLVEKDGELIPRPNCAIDIMNKFAEQHPDFGCTALFFICGSGHIAFSGDGTLEECLKYLVENGHELGNHTCSHAELHKLSPQQIMKELANVESMVRDSLPDYRMRCMSYPYGFYPSEKNRHAVLAGEHEGITYKYDIAFREKPVDDTSSLVTSVKFDSFNAPRIKGSSGEVKDLEWMIKYYNENPDKKYVSDGDANTISVPEGLKNEIDPASCGDRRLNIY